MFREFTSPKSPPRSQVGMQGAKMATLSQDEVQSKVDDRLCDSTRSPSFMAVLRELRGCESDPDDDSILGTSYNDESSSVARVDYIFLQSKPTSPPCPPSADRDAPSKHHELFGPADDMDQGSTALSGAGEETAGIAAIPKLEGW